MDTVIVLTGAIALTAVTDICTLALLPPIRAKGSILRGRPARERRVSIAMLQRAICLASLASLGVAAFLTLAEIADAPIRYSSSERTCWRCSRRCEEQVQHAASLMSPSAGAYTALTSPETQQPSMFACNLTAIAVPAALELTHKRAFVWARCWCLTC